MVMINTTIILANHCHDIDPNNPLRAHIIRGDDWIKETWTAWLKYLNQTFTQYHRSGQQDPEMDEWCSKKELDRWVRATNFKTPGQNLVIWFPSAMVYSICTMDLVDFEGIGRQMPKGTGIDASLDDGKSVKGKKSRGKYNKTQGNNNKNKRNLTQQHHLAEVIQTLGHSESKMAAL
jgi:hypothetical protein